MPKRFGLPAGYEPPSSSAMEPGAQRMPTLGAAAAPPPRSYTLPLTLFALVIRLIVAFVVARTISAHWLFGQATELGCMADSLVQGEGFGSPFCGHTGPSAFLGPGYPLFVAGVFRLYGSHTMHSAVCILFTQALFSIATVPVAMWAARRAFGTQAANLTGLLCAVNPWLIGLEAILWETSLSILLLTALLGLSVALLQEPSRSKLYAAAIVLAIAMWVNPSLILTGLALLVAAFLAGAPSRYSRGTKHRRSEWLMPAILFLVLASVWPLRNLRTLHAFVPLRSNLGYEMWQGNQPGADGFFQAKLHPNVNAEQFQRYKDLGEMGYMREKSHLATVWIEAHPRRFAELTLKRFACFWFGLGRTLSVLLILSTTVLSLTGFAGLLTLLQAQRKLATLFALPLSLLPLPYYISHPDFRFWCLLAPTLTMLSAWWFLHLWAGYRQGTQ